MLKAIKANVIVKAILKEETSDSGLIIKGMSDTPTEAIVMSCGPEVNCGIKEGDRVIVDWGRTAKISYEDQTYYVTGQSNIVGVFGD